MTEAPKRRFYGRRTGKALSARRQALLETLLPRIGIEPGTTPLILSDLGMPQHEGDGLGLWVEIGFGKGEHLCWQAANNPDVLFIGCEPFLNGIAGALALIEDGGLENIRLYPDDARDLLDRLPDRSVHRLFLMHPDPWPKARHANRRFINPAQLDQIARVLKPGGEFRTCTDDPGLKTWTLVQMAQRDDFHWTATRPKDWRDPPEDWIITRYNDKATQEGRSAAYFSFERVEQRR